MPRRIQERCTSLSPAECQRAARSLTWFVSNDYPWFDAVRRNDVGRFANICKALYRGPGAHQKGISAGDAVPHKVINDIELFRKLFCREVWGPLQDLYNSWKPKQCASAHLFRGLWFRTTHDRDVYLKEMEVLGIQQPTSCSLRSNCAQVFANPSLGGASPIYKQLARHVYDVSLAEIG